MVLHTVSRGAIYGTLRGLSILLDVRLSNHLRLSHSRVSRVVHRGVCVHMHSLRANTIDVCLPI